MAGMGKMWGSVFSLFAFCLCASESKILRDIKLFKHECQGKPEYTILHVKARKFNSNDTVHYLWTTIGYPTIVTAHTTDPYVKPVIEWNNCTNYSISFEPHIESMTAFVLTSVFEYLDKKDKQDATINHIRDMLPKFSWKLNSCSNGTDGNPEAMFLAQSFNVTTDPIGQIRMQLKAFANDDYDTTLPHERVSSSSSRFTVSLDDLPTRNKTSRYGLNVAFLKPKGTTVPSYETSKSIDDERTPGIFKLWKLKLPTKAGRFFASWKPVAYSENTRSHGCQTFSHNFPKSASGKLPKDTSYPETIMSSLLNKDIDAYTMTVSFGQTKDKWYRSTNFRSWTGLVGYGDPPESEISLKVYLILIIGLGLPVALSLFGSIYLLIKRTRQGRKSGYEQIN